MKKHLLYFILLSPIWAFAQNTFSGTIAGKIINEKNSGVSFASVQLKGSTTGTTADSLGIFSLGLANQALPFSLLVSAAGYQIQEYRIRTSDPGEILIQLLPQYRQDTIIITSRRRREVLQDVPIPISVIGGTQIDEAGAFNVNRVKEFVPSLQLYTSNPRNTGINIRGLGSPYGLTNDGLDPGVGFYVDGVYYARPAAATLDFIDVERIEVLRGPQGTLFGKNTTSGAISITTRKPLFRRSANFEVSYGNYGYIQAKASVTGPLTKKLAGRISFSGTQRNGVIENLRTNKYTNDINNIGARGQLLYNVSDNTSVTLAADISVQRPDGYAQVVAGVVPTQRAAYRQFNAIISDLNYTLPSLNAYDRKIDHDTPWNSGNDLGGVSVNVDSKIGPGTLTSTTAWRFWNWDPSNDRDFTGLPVLSKSQNPAKHQNWSQELRYAGDISPRLSGVAGLYFIGQEVNIDGTEESGAAQWRFAKSSTSSAWETPGLFEGYGIRTDASIRSISAAAFVNVDWKLTNHIHVLPGLRYNYDRKDVKYNRVASGGLQTSDPALIALKNSVYSSQSYVADADERNLTYQLTVSYQPNKRLNTFATYSTSFKPVGVNVAGLPTVNGQPATDLAVIKPEDVRHYEIGVKSTPADNFTLNITLHNSDIKNYQTNVQSPELGVNRGYIANAEKVRVRGAELDASLRIGTQLSFYTALAYTDAKYIRFPNAPLPLEETGTTKDGVQVAFKDISGGDLPGISKWAGSLGGEFTTIGKFFGQAGDYYIALDNYFRSSFSSSPSPSKYLNVDGYALVNARIGFRVSRGLSASIWARNLLNKNYHEQLLPAGGNAGHYASVLGDPRTFGVTLRYSL